MDLFLSLLLRPFVALAFFLAIWAIQVVIWRLLPDGKLKRALFSPVTLRRKR